VKKINENQSKDLLSIIRCLAVLSIISAHCSSIPDNTSHANHLAFQFVTCYSAIGVGVFFALSGLLFPFSRTKYNTFTAFFSRKITTLFIPWFFCATLVYLYVALRKGGSFAEWSLFVLGYRSLFYYMSVLVVFFAIYFFLYSYNTFLIATCVLSVISDILLGLNILPKSSVFVVYLNPFKWCIYFTTGILISKIGWDRFVRFVSGKFKYGIALVTLFLLFFFSFQKTISFSYTSLFFLPFELLFILGMICWSSIINEHLSLITPIIVRIGKKSFSIYLLHMIVAGPVAFFFNKYDLILNVLFRPFLVCGIAYVSIEAMHFVFKKLGLSNLFSILVGER